MYALKVKRYAILFICFLQIIILLGGCVESYQFGTHHAVVREKGVLSRNTIRLIVCNKKSAFRKSFLRTFLGETPSSYPVQIEFFELRYNLKDIDVNVVREPYYVKKLFASDKFPSNYPDYIYPVRNSDLAVYEESDRDMSSIYNIINTKGQIIKKVVGDVKKNLGRFSLDHSILYYFNSNELHRLSILKNMEETVLSDYAYKLLKFGYKSYRYRATRKADIFLYTTDFASYGGVYEIVDIQNGTVLNTFSALNNEKVHDVAFENGDLYFLLEGSGYYAVRNAEGELVEKFMFKKERYRLHQRIWDSNNKRFCVIAPKFEKSQTGRSYSKRWYEVILWDYKKDRITEFQLNFPL